MKPLVSLLFLSFLLPFLSTAQIINTESFDATQFLPTGWATVGAAPNWTRQTTMSAPITAGPHTGAGMARFRYPTGGTGVSSTETIATPVFDLTGRGNNVVPFSFWIYRDSLMPANNDTLTVYVNTTASLTGAVSIGKVARNRSISIPDTKAQNGWYQYTFNIPLQFAGSTNYVILKGTCFGPSTTARRIYIDDVEWTAFPPACNGTPTGGVLNALNSTFCNGTGSTTVTLNGASVGTGISYQWYTASSLNGPYQAFGFNDTVALTGNLNANQYYFVTVGCNNSGMSMNSDTLTINVSNSQGPNISISYFPNDTICRFDTLTLSASGAVSYTWSTGGNPNLGNTATIQDVPLNTTTYSLVGIDSLGCPSNAVTQTIVVGRRPNITAMNNTNPIVCVGGSSTLNCTANSGVGGGGVTLSYAWSPNGATTATTTVSPATTTLYTVTVTGQYGCTRTDTTSVIVNPNLISPTVVITPDSTGFCQGIAAGPVTIAASSTTAGVTYAWAASAGPPINSTNDSISVNVGNFTVSYIVSVTDPSNGCVNTATATIYIFPTPNVNATAPNATVCLNGSAVVNAFVTNTQGTPLTQYTFNWTPGNITTQMATVTPQATGNYYVTVTSPYGCSNLDSVLITVDTTLVSPTLSVSPSNYILCSNQIAPVQLVAFTDATNPSFQWTPGFISQNNDTITINANNSMNISVSVTDANGCTTSSGATITLSAAPSAGFTSAAGNNFLVDFTNTSSGAVSYSWNFGDGSTSTLTNPSHTYNSAGTWTATLVVTNADGCTDTITQTVVSQLVGIEEATWNVRLYPNPSSNLLHIDLVNIGQATLTISDASGKTIQTIETNSTNNLMNISHLTAGTYFITVQSELGNRVMRLIKND
jgi:PKD repeat protein